MSCNCNSHVKDDNVVIITKAAETDDTKIAMCTSLELATCRAENWQLKKKLIEYEATIKNLEQLVTSIGNKQHQILYELTELRKESSHSSSELDIDLPKFVDECQMENEEDGYKADCDIDDFDDDEFLSQVSTAATSARSIASFLTSSPVSTDGDSELSFYEEEDTLVEILTEAESDVN